MISTILGMVVTLSTAFILVLVWARTKSLHIPMYRLWQLFYGTQEIADPIVRRLIAEETSLMHFRFMYGMRVETLEQCHALARWTAERRIEMSAVARCGSFFDYLELRVRENLPGKFRKAVLYTVGVGSLMLAASILSEGPSMKSALVQFRASQRYFWLSVDSARPLRPADIPPVTTGDCKSPSQSAAHGQFTVREREIVCASLGDPVAVASFVSRALRTQQIILAVASIFFLYLTLAAVSVWRSIGAAYRLKARLSLSPQRPCGETLRPSGGCNDDTRASPGTAHSALGGINADVVHQ